MPSDRAPLPRWAPRVPPEKIRRLYELDALGIVDEELIDEVAFALRARCESILGATEASRGRLKCPSCEAPFEAEVGPGTTLRCERCGWTTPWERYSSTYRHHNLMAGAGEPVFREYLERFPAADTPRKRLLLVDWVVHQCHQSLPQREKGLLGRPVAVNLIDARLHQILRLIDELAYGHSLGQDSDEARNHWLEHVMSAYPGYAVRTRWPREGQEGDRPPTR